MRRTRSFLKWAGNKYRYLDPILQALPKADRLIEPFTGSASIFINTSYPQYLLGEDNADLINLFRWVQQEGSTFIDYCASFFCPDNNDENQYYALRTQFNHCTNPKDRAALFLYLNRHGYNGLCRYSQKNNYNVPFGRHKAPYFPRAEMLYFHQKSHVASFIHQDFRETFKKALPGDIVYCDPPYAPLTEEKPFAYTGRKFQEAEQFILASLAEEYANKGITVVISNHDTEFTRKLYQKGHITTFKVQRFISCHGNNRGRVRELIAVFR